MADPFAFGDDTTTSADTPATGSGAMYLHPMDNDAHALMVAERHLELAKKNYQMAKKVMLSHFTMDPGSNVTVETDHFKVNCKIGESYKWDDAAIARVVAEAGYVPDYITITHKMGRREWNMLKASEKAKWTHALTVEPTTPVITVEKKDA